jgi:protein-tyrosine phosphatase
MTAMDAAHDRARGALLGLAAGDAVGTTVEFMAPGSFEPVTDMAGGGPFRLAAGQWTDDTSMALCLAESLVECGGHDPGDQMRRYLRWWREGYFSPTGRCFDIGTTTRHQLARFERTGEPHDPAVDQESAANGSLMRLSPVAIRWATNLGDDADTTAAIAGQLAGAMHGASGIPPEWLGKLAMRGRIESLADALHRAAAGRRLLWEHDLDFHGWWADPEGRLLGGEYPGHRDDPATTRRKLALLAAEGVGTIIDLTDDDDWLTPYADHVAAVAAEQGVSLERLSHPIPDQGVTSPEHYDRIMADIERALAGGRKVFVHCWGGIGRTGTVVGIWHVHRGHSPDAALERIAAARKGTIKAGRPSPETPVQVEAIRQAHARRGL